LVRDIQTPRGYRTKQRIVSRREDFLMIEIDVLSDSPSVK